MPEYTVDDVAVHNTRNDLWVIIHGNAYNITDYMRDHPGGADVLLDVAGTDATEAYEDVNHSEDADEILKTFLVGSVKGAHKTTKPKQTVRVIQQTPRETEPTAKSSRLSIGAITLTAASVGGAAHLTYKASQANLKSWEKLAKLLPTWSHKDFLKGGFSGGFFAASLISVFLGGVSCARLLRFTKIDSGFTRYPPHVRSHKVAKPDPHLAKGFLEQKEFKKLPLTKKEQLSPNVYRFVFQLPNPKGVIGLPIGQHVAIKATTNGQAVTRSYTPISNNLDLGRLELVVKCYPDGLLTGQYLANLKEGDKVLFRGPKGAMKYHQGLCKRIGMIAGGTGITPMYQLIRAICENDTDMTEISLIYANRAEEDILLRQELETFARNYPKNLKLWYMLDHPPRGWKYGKGYVTPDVMAKRLPGPSPDTKVLLCGPPGMVNASKKSLVGMGFQAPSSVPKMTDQIFFF